jgi:predicted NAD/FAD-binding protein
MGRLHTMKTRRDFMKGCSLAAGSLLLPSFQSCSPKNQIKGRILGPDFSLGHKVREIQNQKATEIIKEDIVIVGGGIAGLSAARWLNKNNQAFTLLELESDAGGNSRAGQTANGAFPLGAHYLPLPSIENHNLLDFLLEAEVITGFDNQLPIYNEYHLCHDPKERLFINHYWQEGLVPHEGLPQKDRAQIQSFLSLMEEFRIKIGDDGKLAFDIPVDKSSRDKSLMLLDTISMRDFLSNNQFNSPYLHWYVNYCCADDYGADLNDTSAWAGIHYFASRKGSAANAKSDDVLTWPEGNFWLVKELKKNFIQQIKPRSVALSVQPNKDFVMVDYFDGNKMEFKSIQARSVIMATPQFVNKHIIRTERGFDYQAFQYAPWIVANLTISSGLNGRMGEPLCWDNVIYGSQSLGYVNSSHQNLSIQKENTTISYYQPLTGRDCAAMRKQMQSKTWEYWMDTIMNDLKQAHPNLIDQTSQLDVWTWGHGMIRPQPGFIWGTDRMAAKKPINNNIFFAHSDLSGISIFEEAFNNGIEAAKSVIQQGA